MAHHFGGKINWFRPKIRAQRRAHDWENQDASYGPRHGPTKRFNLLQMTPNWLLGIWNLDPPSKVTLSTPW
jgi:hypothetical protein